ncbi:uncharacterized protein ASCRUDRAFT_73898 [Ascoidea rubescens DSM 1968]|uniref:Uncharacterized protein n=1 Tax=Ascoidea rubescens DSM 1968 TaxID=1344418 RepID=A0A1D2VRK6_9ASCO|nr:hypothetical protein ASCRUDRAFT_73898 [Ascoidea rubescens DSM 1968]ODV64230.1 hypothetical protein ASCRUDRAFT_73898 [Ascoidea rubescens DSM 1968]
MFFSNVVLVASAATGVFSYTSNETGPHTDGSGIGGFDSQNDSVSVVPPIYENNVAKGSFPLAAGVVGVGIALLL